MTAIVYIKDLEHNRVLMGADSMISGRNLKQIDLRPKITKYPGYLIAAAGPSHMCEAFTETLCLDVNELIGTNSCDYLKTSSKKHLRYLGYMEKNGSLSASFHETHVIVATRSRIFHISVEALGITVEEVKSEYGSIGSGSLYCKGSLEATKDEKDLNLRLNLALSAAGTYSPECNLAFTLEKIS